MESISVIEDKDEGHEKLTDIDDDSTVRRLVDMIVEAPVDDSENIGVNSIIF